MKLKKYFALALSAVLLVLVLAACGSSTSTTSTTGTEAVDDTAEVEPITIKLGVTGSIYEDVWAPAQEKLKDEGINLELVQFSDFSLPNNALANGEIDLNAFQHRIFLESDIAANGYEIQSIANTLIGPMHVFSDKISSLDELQDGDIIAIPNDVTNGGRALKILESAGIITLNADAGFNPTVDDIETRTADFEIQELAANAIPSALPDVTAAVINSNYAMDFGLKADEAIFQDGVLDQEEYWALVAARTADLEDPEKVAIYEKVIDAFQTPETEQVFNDTFGGYFIAVGWDEDLLHANG